MYKNYVVLCLVFSCLIVLGISQKSCDDCVPWPSCSKAAELVNQRTSPDLLRHAFCGFEDDTPKTCCSQVYRDLIEHPKANLLPRDCGPVDGKRIVGGTVAGIYEFPWMVLISYSTGNGFQFNCGGSLINNRYVLTAAHCIQNLTIAGVRAGEHTIGSAHDCERQGENIVCESHLQEEEIEKAIMHEGYRRKPYVTNDIGLLRLKNPIDFSFKNTKAVCLPLSNSLRYMDITEKNLTVAGWGYTENRMPSSKMLKVTIPVHTKKSCKENLNKNNHLKDIDFSLNTFCAGEYGKDSCGGDSGGPIMLNSIYNNVTSTIQYGIVSYGPLRCGSGFPGVYTDVTKFMIWILDNIEA